MEVKYEIFQMYAKRDCESFNAKEIALIKRFINTFNSDFTQCVITLLADNVVPGKIISPLMAKAIKDRLHSSKRNHYFIQKVVDEYYIVNHDVFHTYYLLDQFDEFKEFLEDLKISYLDES